MPHTHNLTVADANFDPRAFAEPEDIVSKLPASLSTALTSSKWKERKEVLDELQAVLNATPRIKDAPALGDLAKSLAARVQADANINCVMTAAACLEALAKGMSASFSRFRETVVPPMLERLKERKATVTDAIGTALDAVFLTVSELVVLILLFRVILLRRLLSLTLYLTSVPRLGTRIHR